MRVATDFKAEILNKQFQLRPYRQCEYHEDTIHNKGGCYKQKESTARIRSMQGTNDKAQ